MTTLEDRIMGLGSPSDILNTKNRAARINILEHGTNWCRLEYQPGNASMYALTMVETQEHLVIAWLWRGGTGGEVMAVIKNLAACIGYYASKSGINEADVEAILKLVKELGYVPKVER